MKTINEITISSCLPLLTLQSHHNPVTIKQHIFSRLRPLEFTNHLGAIPNFATEKEQKRNFLDFTDVTLVVVDIKSERFVKCTCLEQDLFDMTMVTIMFDTKTSESESFIDMSIEGIINIMMEFHHF